MDEKLYLGTLKKYKEWSDNNKKQVEKDLMERHAMCEEMQSYTEDRIASLSNEEFYDMIAPLWAMRMWGNKQYYIDSIIANNGMPLIRVQLSKLFWAKSPLEKRWDDFRSNIKGIDPAIMSELLNKFNPEEFILWNKKSLTAFHALKVQNVPEQNASLDGKRYAYLCKVGKDLVKLAKGKGYHEIDNLLALDYFLWKELQAEASTEALNGDESHETAKQKAFVHNDVRDKICDIGRFLGFNASPEQKVANGAVVDAIWDASVGNMGRITYVFEVQTNGSIDSLLLNLMKAKNNPSVQGIVAVSDATQIEKIRKEASSLKDIRDELKYWDYNDVLKVYDSLSSAYESINKLHLVPEGYNTK